MRRTTLLLSLLLASATAAAGTPGMRVELYHVNVTAGEADVSIDNGSLSETATVDSGANNDFGLRFLGWAADSPLTGGVDVAALSTVESSGPMLDATVTTLSFFGGLRAQEPLFGSSGHGLRPYALVGLSLASARGSMRTQTMQTDFDTATGGSLMSGGKSSPAPYLAAGVEWSIADHVAVTVDYRAQKYDVDSDVYLSSNKAGFRLDASGIGVGIAWTTPPHAPKPAPDNAPAPAPETPAGAAVP